MPKRKIRCSSAKGSKLCGIFFLVSLISISPGNCSEPIPIDLPGLMSIGLDGGLSADGDYILSGNITVGTFGELSSAAAYIVPTFRGTLDGGGYTIDNLDRPLFYKIEGNVGGEGEDKVSDYAEVKNLELVTSGLGVTSSDPGVKARGVLSNDITFTKLTDVEVSGILKVENDGLIDNDFASIGGLVGSATNSYIVNSKSAVEVIAPEMIKVGGLVGSASWTNISDSSSTGDVFGTRQVGGLVGVAGNSVITNSSASGDVIASNFDTPKNPDEIIGGLIGRVGYSSIVGSVSNGDVIGKTDVGGLVGMMDHSIVMNSKVSNAATVTGLSRVGGFVGYSMYDEISGSESAATVIGTDLETTGSFAGVQILSKTERSFSVNSNDFELIGKARESIVTNSFTFKIQDSEKIREIVSFIREVIDSEVIEKFEISNSKSESIEILLGKPIQIEFQGVYPERLKLLLLTPDNEWIVLGELEIKEGRLVLPTFSFDSVGTYILKIISSDSGINSEAAQTEAIAELKFEVED